MGPPSSGRVLHAGPHAWYVRLDDPSVVLGVLTRSAVRVPCGISTALAQLPGGRAHGPAAVGGGRLLVRDLRVRVTRLVDHRVPRLRLSPVERVRVAGRLRGLLRRPYADVAAELGTRSLDALRDGEPAAVDRLLGRGSGLTPLGDDVLAGWLATAFATERHDRAAVADRVGAAGATTAFSATLLDRAAHGEVVPQFRRLGSALANGPADAVPERVAELLRIGHTSGAGLAVGSLLALEGMPVR